MENQALTHGLTTGTGKPEPSSWKNYNRSRLSHTVPAKQTGAAIKPDPFESARPGPTLFLDVSIILKHSSFKRHPLPPRVVLSGASSLTSLGLLLSVLRLGLSLSYPVPNMRLLELRERTFCWNVLKF